MTKTTDNDKFIDIIDTLLKDNDIGGGEVYIDEVDYYNYNYETQSDMYTVASGTIDIDLFIDELRKGRVSTQTLSCIKNEFDRIDRSPATGEFNNTIKEENKLHVVLSYTPELFDDGIQGVYLDI